MLPGEMRAWLLMLALVGCKDKITSVGESNEVSRLSLEDATQFCKDMRDYQRKSTSASDRRSVMCAARALASGSFKISKDKDDDKDRDKDRDADRDRRDACHREYDKCMDRDDDKDDIEMDCSSDKVRDSLSDCPGLTVGEMSDCLREMPERYAALAKQDPCNLADEVDDFKAMERYFDKLKGPKCELVEKKCSKRKHRKVDPDNPYGDDESALGSLQQKAQSAQKLEALEELKRKLCACRDRTCLDEHKEAMRKARTDYSTNYTAEEQERRVKIEAEALKCETDLMMTLGL